jgi:hypothetical protein
MHLLCSITRSFFLILSQTRSGGGSLAACCRDRRRQGVLGEVWLCFIGIGWVSLRTFFGLIFFYFAYFLFKQGYFIILAYIHF